MGKTELNQNFGLVVVGIIVLTILVLGFAFFLQYWLLKKVRQNSEYYKAVLRLNEQTRYYTRIAHNGNVEYVMQVKSKAQFDRTDPFSSLHEYLQQYPGEIRAFLEMAHRNRSAHREYIAKFNTLFSKITQEECEKLHIPYERFLKIEQKLVDAEIINMVQTISATCYVEYTSPQGRNHYLKHCTFLESEIRTALQDIKERKAYQLSEEYRRKNERSKVTASMRYNVLRRDGGKCRLCGRTADDGVTLEVDHIVPISKGGTTTYNNLQTLCRDCNRGKSTKI